MWQPINENRNLDVLDNDANDAFNSLLTLFASSTEPEFPEPFMLWADTADNVLKMRLANNLGWWPIFGLQGFCGPFAYDDSSQKDLLFGVSTLTHSYRLNFPSIAGALNDTLMVSNVSGSGDSTIVDLSWGTNAIGDLDDVNAAAPTVGDLLEWDGSDWVSKAIDLSTRATGLRLLDAGLLQLQDDAQTAFVSLRAPATLAGSYTLTFPTGAPPSNNYILEFSSSGAASWISTPTGGGGASSLGQLTDVVLSTPESGEVLEFDGSNWVNVDPGKGGGSSTLDGLDDVTLTSPQSGMLLRFNGSEWIDSFAIFAELNGVNLSGLAAGHSLIYDGTNFVNSAIDFSTIIDEIHIRPGGFLQMDGAITGAVAIDVPNAINNYTITLPPDAPNAGDVMTFDSAGNASFAAATPASLSGLSDTAIATPLNNQVLKYSSGSARWVNASIRWSDVLDAAPGITTTQDVDLRNGATLTLHDDDNSSGAKLAVPSAVSGALYTLTLPVAGPQFLTAGLSVGAPDGDPKVLEFDTTGQASWKKAPSVKSITDLQDVVPDNPFATGQLLTWSIDGHWENLPINQNTLIATLLVEQGGALTLQGATSGSVSLIANNAGPSYTLAFPSGTANASGQVLQFNDVGVGSWQDPGASQMAELTDVTVADLGDGDILIFNAGAFHNTGLRLPTGIPATNNKVIQFDNTGQGIFIDTPSGGGGGSSTFDGLTDTNLSSPAQGHVLQYDSGNSAWQNSAVLTMRDSIVFENTAQGNAAGTLAFGHAVPRTWTLPNQSGEITVLGNSASGTGSLVRNSTPTLTLPIITSFANSQHDHLDSAGGGVLSADAIGSGTLDAGRLPDLSDTYLALDSSNARVISGSGSISLSEANFFVGNNSSFVVGFLAALRFGLGSVANSVNFVPPQDFTAAHTIELAGNAPPVGDSFWLFNTTGTVAKIAWGAFLGTGSVLRGTGFTGFGDVVRATAPTLASATLEGPRVKAAGASTLVTMTRPGTGISWTLQLPSTPPGSTGTWYLTATTTGTTAVLNWVELEPPPPS